MAQVLHQPEFGAGNPLGQSQGVLDREHRIRSSVHDEGRRHHLTQPVEPGGRGVDRRTVSGLRIPAPLHLIEGHPDPVLDGHRIATPGEHLVQFHDPGHPFPMAGRGWGEEPLCHPVDQPVGGRGQALVAQTRGGAQQRQRDHPVGMVQRHDLTDHAPHGSADQMCPVDPMAVHDRAGVIGEIVQRVADLHRHLGREAAVPVVVAHDAMAEGQQWLDQLRRPARAVRIGSRDQQNRAALRCRGLRLEHLGMDLDLER